MVVAMAVLVCGFFVKNLFFQDKGPEIITTSQLYKIVNVSELSAYQCVYNDVCTVYDSEDSSKVLYHCYYEAKVNAGLDFSKIGIKLEKVSEKKRIIRVSGPKVHIEEPTVDIETLDYMFEDDSANTETISEEALKKVKTKSNRQNGMKFIWREDQNPDALDVYRCDINSDDKRSPEEICQQEIKNAVCVTLIENGPLGKAALSKETIRTMGYKRSGPALVEAVERGIKFAKKTGEICLNGEKSFVMQKKINLRNLTSFPHPHTTKARPYET